MRKRRKIVWNQWLRSRLAEPEGFEPSIPFNRYAALAKRCLQPLGHSSITAAYARPRGEPQAPDRALPACAENFPPGRGTAYTSIYVRSAGCGSPDISPLTSDFVLDRCQVAAIRDSRRPELTIYGKKSAAHALREVCDTFFALLN